MSDILDKILSTKRREVAEAKSRVPMVELEAIARSAAPVRDFAGAIRAKHAAGKPGVIAEIKKASPSVGVFRTASLGEFDPAAFAHSYETHGAACLSVLTDRDYFQGSPDDLIAARAACALPVLRKDFVIDPYQIVEARAMGADAVLFIMGAVDIALFREWEALAVSLGLTVLAESHTRGELEDALSLKTPLIGVNNRDLTRFVTDVGTTIALRRCIPAGRVVVTESGIDSPEIIGLMARNQVQTYLIGGVLMGKSDPGAALGALFGGRL